MGIRRKQPIRPTSFKSHLKVKLFTGFQKNIAISQLTIKHQVQAHVAEHQDICRSKFNIPNYEASN